MNKIRMKFRLMASVIAFVSLGTLAIPAQASFIQNTDFSNDFKMFIDIANSDAANFLGFVGANNSSAPNIGVTTTGNVDTGSGWSNIKPSNTADPFTPLTSLVFTPADATLFSDFSFRAQLENVGFTGNVDVIVTDQFDVPWTVNFTGLAGPNADFGRIGVVSNDGGLIKSVEILTPFDTILGQESFKEVKQIGFSFASGVTPPPSGEPIPAPEPSSLALLGLGLIASVFSLRRRSSSLQA